MKAELVMIGTELLLGETVDTNAAYLAQELAALGIDLYYKSTVGDNWIRMIEVITQALARSDLVIVSGGLGPTIDDLTREAVAAVANLPLELNTEAMEMIEAYFRQSNRTMRKQPQAGLSAPGCPHHSQPLGHRSGTDCPYSGQGHHCAARRAPGVKGHVRRLRIALFGKQDRGQTDADIADAQVCRNRRIEARRNGRR